MAVRIIKRRLKLLGTGIALPGKPITTPELTLRLEQNFDINISREARIIAKRLGIESRFICRDFVNAKEQPRAGDTNPDLATKALAQALSHANKESNQLTYLFGHTTTPHTLLPPNIAWVADNLGYNNPYVELRQACTGFANALQLAAGMLNDAEPQTLGIVGSETGSVFFDPQLLSRDRHQLVNLVQMGDGAGAAIIGSDDGQPGSTLEALYFGTLGVDHKPGFYLQAGGSFQTYLKPERSVIHFEHDFNEVKEKGLMLFEQGLKAAQLADINLFEIDWFIPHQANAKLGQLLSTHFGLPEKKIFINANQVGNLGSASIWVALHQLRTSGLLKTNDKVLILGAEATKYLYGGFLYTH